MRQKCGSECRNGCGFVGLRGGLRRFPVGNWGLRGGNRGCLRLVCFVFGFKKEGDVSRRSHAKENIRRFQARLTFLYFVFRCLRGAKVVFFLFVRVFSWRKNSVCFVGFGGLRGGLRRLPVAVSGLSVVVLGFVVMFGRFQVGNGGLRGGFVSFSCGKRKRTSHDVPKNKNEKIKYRFYEPFSFVSFSAFAWCKGSVFFVCSGEKLFFFWGFQSGFSVFAWWVSGFFRLVSAKMGVGFGGLRVSNAAVAVFEKAVKFYCKGRYVGGGGCYYGSVYAVSGYESEACEEGDG